MIDKSVLAKHPVAVQNIVRFLDSSHLADPALQFVVQRFENLAAELLNEMKSSPDLTLALRKIVDAKNYAVMSKIVEMEAKGQTVQTQTNQ